MNTKKRRMAWAQEIHDVDKYGAPDGSFGERKRE
jgi:hypothetical protein